jgi:hypothetical protein
MNWSALETGAWKVHADSAASGWAEVRTYRIPKFVLGFFGLDSVVLTENSTRDPCYDIWSVFADNYSGVPIIESRGASWLLSSGRGGVQMMYDAAYGCDTR